MQPCWKLNTSHPILRGRRSADVVIVGGGMSGLHTALLLCTAGLRVILLEAETLCCGATGRCTGMVTIDFGACSALVGRPTLSELLRTQQAALQFLKGRCSYWRDQDAYWLAIHERASSLQKAMTDCGLQAEVAQGTQCPLAIHSDALLVRNQGLLNPPLHFADVLLQAEQLGLQVFEHSRVVALENALAITQRGSVAAPYIVLATGFPILNFPGSSFLKLRQRRMDALLLTDVKPFEGMYIDAAGHFALYPFDGDAVFRQLGGWVGGKVDKAPVEQFQRQYRCQMEFSDAEPLCGGFETFSTDGVPLIGSLSAKTPHLFVASGFGGHGLVNSIVAAQTISAEILGVGKSRSAYCSPTRFSPLSLIAPLGRQLVRYASGVSRRHAPRCPHMGCKLVYRPDTRLWECPCHGSSFSDIGQVRNAPAVTDVVIHRPRS